MELPSLRLTKRERLCSTTAIDALFAARGAKGALAYPLRMVWAERPQGRRQQEVAPVQFLISVPKKRLRHAVDRVQMRRRIREAYRLNRSAIPEQPASLDVAFIYVAPKLEPYFKVERAMIKLLSSLGQ